MKKILKASLILSAVLFCGCMFAEQLFVTDAGDDANGQTLRNIIQGAQSGDVIKFAAPSSEPPITTITLTQGAIPITEPITIDGGDGGVTIQFSIKKGYNNNRVFYICTSSGITTFKNLTIDGGDLSYSSSLHGAGINLQSGNLVLDHVTVQDGKAAFGGGIYVGTSDSSATLTLQNGTVIAGNQATNSGGGIYVDGKGVVNINPDCVVGKNYDTDPKGAPNSAPLGGGIFVCAGGQLNINNSLVSQNVATSYGGGVYSFGTTNISNQSLISDNKATICGGGIYVDSGATVTIAAQPGSNPYVQGNIAHQSGGGIYVNNGGTLSGTSFYTVGNRADCNGGGICVNTNGKATLSNAIISNNTAQNGGGIFSLDSTNISNQSLINNNSATNDGGGCYALGVNSFSVSNSTISGNTAACYGGGFYSYSASVNLNTSTSVNNNTASYGGGGYIATQGGIITNSTIENNSATTDGGGLYLAMGGITTITYTQVLCNTAKRNGGGIAVVNKSSFFAYTGSNIAGNQLTGTDLKCGAGIYAYKAETIKIQCSTIANNWVINDYDDAFGGGIYNMDSTLYVMYSTINNNQTGTGDITEGDSGGGIYTGKSDDDSQYGSYCYIISSTIYDNSSGHGAGVYNDDVVAIILNSTIVKNRINTGNSHVGAGVESCAKDEDDSCYNLKCITDICNSLIQQNTNTDSDYLDIGSVDDAEFYVFNSWYGESYDSGGKDIETENSMESIDNDTLSLTQNPGIYTKTVNLPLKSNYRQFDTRLYGGTKEFSTSWLIYYTGGPHHIHDPWYKICGDRTDGDRAESPSGSLLTDQNGIESSPNNPIGASAWGW